MLLVEPFLRGNAVALVKKGKLQDFFVDFESAYNSLVGATFTGEVDRFSKNSNSCFVKLPDNQVGFLKRARGLKSGERLLLQSRFFPPKDKALVVTTDISFKGRYVVITPRKRIITCSRKITEKKRRQSLYELAEKFGDIRDRKHGIIFRSICSSSPDEKIKGDIEEQLLRCNRITSMKPNEIMVLKENPNALERAWQEWPLFEKQEIINEAGCFDNFSIWEQILALKETTVKLSFGGNISIEPTQALVAIDVNTGSDSSRAAGLKANLQAISEVPRQLRIRGLGGKIVIEMGPLLSKHREKIEAALKQNITLYSDKIKIAGWTNLGNLELEKSRDRMQLEEVHFAQIEKNVRL